MDLVQFWQLVEKKLMEKNKKNQILKNEIWKWKKVKDGTN